RRADRSRQSARYRPRGSRYSRSCHFPVSVSFRRWYAPAIGTNPVVDLRHMFTYSKTGINHEKGHRRPNRTERYRLRAFVAIAVAAVLLFRRTAFHTCEGDPINALTVSRPFLSDRHI